ncbi:UDP-glucosyl transferase 73C [Vigna unguiculata]|uniref:UDP-glucosyl transferase 73C n=1 Tax=Vigna unguiculata TaxID=3917 RepID=A0A4D6M9K1_VIGUN|nr:UDP-glucosyl transferase 73C [Vigna unguiculata]
MDSTPLCNLHFVFVPIMAPGHLLPMVDMAKMFARRKVKVSIVTTTLNSIHFQASIDREIQSGSPIQILHVPFPWAEAGLPEGCESADAVPSMDLLSNFTVAEKVHEGLSYDEKFLVPGMPHRIELRSFEELEAEYVKEYERVTGNKVWCVGPVSLCNKDYTEKALRNKRNWSDEDRYVKWLDSWPARSVIYVCLGSLNRATPEQLIELGLGLEATKRPFIWVLGGAYGREEMEKWLLEDGFEERVKERGILIKGWVPQVLILSHRAIGAFLTHCGWNSTLEGICAGVPLLTFPLFSEQFLNEKIVVQVVENGVSLGAESVVHLGEEDKARVQVTKENVADSIEKVMGEGKEKQVFMERARNYADMAKKTVEEGGSSYKNMSLLIQDIASFKMP